METVRRIFSNKKMDSNLRDCSIFIIIIITIIKNCFFTYTFIQELN